jgi:hypothetical protein
MRVTRGWIAATASDDTEERPKTSGADLEMATCWATKAATVKTAHWLVGNAAVRARPIPKFLSILAIDLLGQEAQRREYVTFPSRFLGDSGHQHQVAGTGYCWYWKSRGGGELWHGPKEG